MRALPLALILAGLLPWGGAGCAAPDAASGSASPPSLRGPEARYLPLFEALRETTNAHEDATARRIALNLRARIAADRARGITSGTEEALVLLKSFETVLRGRALVDSLEVELVARPLGGRPLGGRNVVELVLRLRSAEGEPFVLRPGAPVLRTVRVSRAPDGREGRVTRRTSVSGCERLELAGEEWREIALGPMATTIPRAAMATQTRWTLELGFGEARQGGRSYPAADLASVSLERVDLAAFLPNAAIEPAELARFAAREEFALAPLLERTVRIVPERRGEALDLLAPLVERMTAEELERLVPVLRWLSGVATPVRDPLAWREWIRRRTDTAASFRRDP